MLSSLFSAGTIVGLAFGLAFLGLCLANLRVAIYVYVVFGVVNFIQVLSFAGEQVEQGLMLVEVMATVMIAVWWVKYRQPGRQWLNPQFEKPLVVLILVSLLSIVTGFLWPDPAVDQAHMKLPVSIGQVMLIIWPVGSYFVIANVVSSVRQIRNICRIAVILAIPTLFLPLVPESRDEYLNLSVYFSLMTAPLCFVQMLRTRSPLKKVALAVLSMAPLIHGINNGKAFFYGYAIVSISTILFLQARLFLFGLIPIAVGLYLLVLAPGSVSAIPTAVKDLLVVERQQQSWGGKSGRVQLAVDALSIWKGHPVLGVGAGNSWPYMHRYSAIDTPHNQYLNVLVEFGLVGLVCFLLFIWHAFKMGLDLRRRVRDPFQQIFVLGWLGSCAGMAVGALTGDFILPSIRNGGLSLFSGFYWFWVLLGLAASLKRMETQPAEPIRKGLARP